MFCYNNSLNRKPVKNLELRQNLHLHFYISISCGQFSLSPVSLSRNPIGFCWLLLLVLLSQTTHTFIRRPWDESVVVAAKQISQTAFFFFKSSMVTAESKIKPTKSSMLSQSLIQRRRVFLLLPEHLAGFYFYCILFLVHWPWAAPLVRFIVGQSSPITTHISKCTSVHNSH